MPVGAAVEGLEDPLLLTVGDAGAAIGDAHHHARADPSHAHAHRLAVGVAQGVLDQVREDALELRGVGEQRRRLGVHRQLHAPGGRRQRVLGGEQHLLDRDGFAPRLHTPGLQAREVEQLVDQRRQPLALLDHSGAHLVAFLAGERARAERVAGGHDRGQRRAQVM